jgi:hypothetical protein
MRDLLGMPWLIWLIPTVASLGGLMLVGMLLEVPRMRHVREVRPWTLFQPGRSPGSAGQCLKPFQL